MWFRSQATPIQALSAVRFRSDSDTMRTHSSGQVCYPLQHEPSDLYGYCARCLAAYARLEPTA
jgi:hypothetical protein